MYIGIPSSPEEGKKILTSPKFEEATAPIWYSYGLSPRILYHIRHSLSIKTFRNAEHIVPRPARYIVLFAMANNISYRHRPIYLAPSADGAL